MYKRQPTDIDTEPTASPTPSPTPTPTVAVAEPTDTLAEPAAADPFVGAGSDSANPPASFAFRVTEGGLPEGEFRWSNGKLRLTATALASVERVACPDGYTACALIRGEASTERLTAGDWSPGGAVTFSALIMDGTKDGFGLRLQPSTAESDLPRTTELSAGAITIGAEA